MEKNRLKIVVLILAFCLTVKAEEKQLIPVNISFMEALAPKDTTSSERFQKEYEFAIQTGKSLTDEKLKKCGYKINEEKVLYDASDNLQAMEQAKNLEAGGSWLIVGPRRSNHYLLAVRGASSTPSVSIMASANEVFELGTLHLTLAHPNKRMAEVLAKQTLKKIKGKKGSYISVVSEDCVSCVDLAKNFDHFAKVLGLKKIHELKIVGEQPDLSSLEKIIKNKKTDFLLLPNYSIVSAYVMGSAFKWNSNLYFVGGDGWGDAMYGFVHKSPQLTSVSGITVKSFPPADKGLEYFELGKVILKNPDRTASFPKSGSAQALLKTIEGISDILCKYKPKDKSEFVKIFKSNGTKYFNNPWGVSVYKLSQGEIIFEKTVK